MKRHVLLGTDFWTDCDDVAALRLLCRYAKQGVWTVDGVILNACMPYSAPALDGFLKREGVVCPIGIDRDAVDFGGNPPYQKRMAEVCGSRMTNEDCEEGVSLYRRLLAANPDGETDILEIGYPQVLAALLLSPPDVYSPLDGTALFVKKIRHVWVMGGNWADGGHGKENNFSRNRRAAEGAHTFLARCPVPITFLGFEVGCTVMTRPIPEESDPLFRAFRDHGSEKGRSSWDPMLVLLAASDDPAAGYETKAGLASVDPVTGENFFDFAPVDPPRMDSYVVKQRPDAWYEEKLTAALFGN